MRSLKNELKLQMLEDEASQHHGQRCRFIARPFLAAARPSGIFIQSHLLAGDNRAIVFAAKTSDFRLSTFDFALNQFQELRFSLCGAVLPLFNRGLECADPFFG